MIKISLLDSIYDLCFDTDYTMSLIDRKFLRQVLLDVEIREIPTFMTVKDIENNRYNISQYIKLKIYLFEKNITILIKREFYIVEDLTVKVLIGIDIIKPEAMTVDLSQDLMRIGACEDIKVFIVITIRDSHTNVIIYSSKKMTILSYSNVIISITKPRKRLSLFKNRDFIFES